MAAQIIQTFSFETDSQIRTILDDNEEPLFCLVDVCNILQLTTPSRTKEQIEEEFGDGVTLTHPIIDRLGREQSTTFITEPQLYFVMMRSRAKIARQFRQWIVNEVLPALRKHGHYETVKKNNGPEFSDKDMVLIRDFIYQYADAFKWSRCFLSACWSCLRKATGTKSPDKFKYSDLDAIINELKRISIITDCYLYARQKAEEEIFKKIMRENGNSEELKAILESMVIDAADDSAFNKIKALRRSFIGKDLERLTQNLKALC